MGSPSRVQASSQIAAMPHRGDLHLNSIAALFAAAAAVAAIAKRERRDFEVPKLEGLWWFDEDKPLSEVPRDRWRWKLLIRVPDDVSKSILAEAKSVVPSAKKTPRIKDVALETIDEGRSIQMLHVGPYENEPETVATIFPVMKERGLSPHGHHHEIYLSDARKVEPSTALTIIRYPVKKA